MNSHVTLEEQVMRAGQRQQEENQMSEGYGIQLSIKLGEDMVVVRGDTPEEFEERRKAIEANADGVLDTLDKFRQVALAKGLTRAGFTPAPADTAHSTVAAGATATELRCIHGPYKDLKGKRSKNKPDEPYKYRYYCPGPFGKGCKPEDLPGQEEGS